MQVLYSWVQPERPHISQPINFRCCHYQGEHDLRWFEGKEPEEISLQKQDAHGIWIEVSCFGQVDEVLNILHLLRKQ